MPIPTNRLSYEVIAEQMLDKRAYEADVLTAMCYRESFEAIFYCYIVIFRKILCHFRGSVDTLVTCL